MRAELRQVKRDGSLGEILPKWTDLTFLDDSIDVGGLTFTYLNADAMAKYLTDRAELAVLINGKEPANSRFILDEHTGNDVQEVAPTTKFSAQSILCRLDECQLMPRRDAHAREDQITDAEQKAYEEAAREWAQKARKQDAKDQRDSEKGDENTNKSDEKNQNKKDKEEFAPDDTNQDGKIDWHDFTPGAAMQRSLDNAPPAIAPRWKDATPGEVLIWILREGKRRGAIDELKIGFTADRDSDGKKWDEKLTHRFDIGMSALDVVRWMYDAGKAECRMNGRTVNLYNTSTGTDRRYPKVTLASGKNILDAPKAGTARGQATAVFVNSDTGVHGWVVDKDLVRTWGRIESYLPVQGLKTWDECEDRGRAYLASNGVPRYQYVYGVQPGAGADPYDAFQVADWIYVLAGNSEQRRRVRQISLTWGSGDSDVEPTMTVTLNNLLLEKSIARDRAIKGGRGRTLTADATTSGRQPGTAYGDGVAPNQPSAPIVTSRAGTHRIAWDGLDINGNDMSFDTQYVELHASKVAAFIPDDTTLVDTIRAGGSKIINNQVYGDKWFYRFIPLDLGGDRGDASDTGSGFVTLDTLQIGDLSPGILINDALGIRAYNTAGAESFSVDPLTGNVIVYGRFSSDDPANGNERVEIFAQHDFNDGQSYIKLYDLVTGPVGATRAPAQIIGLNDTSKGYSWTALGIFGPDDGPSHANAFNSISQETDITNHVARTFIQSGTGGGNGGIFLGEAGMPVSPSFTVLGNGIKSFNFNQESVTLGAGGNGTVTHNLGRTPTTVVCTSGGAVFWAIVTATTSTTFTVQCYNSAGTLLTSTSRVISWIAIA